MKVKIHVNPNRALGRRDPKIYGQFIEHFHNQIYGGIYDPDSPSADEDGLRQDVAEAVRRLNPPVIRWPGGCFVSAYHWEDGVGPERRAHFDKAWRVEESNAFGTDEFIKLCRKVQAEPYICTNAGTGTPEEMSNWVEYCNLRSEGKYAKQRIANGHEEPFNVKYWSIGNENYLPGEMGAKTAAEWGKFVRESAKMMKRVDPKIEILAASVPDLDWNLNLLRDAGRWLDWISIHGYWDPLWQNNDLSPYEKCMSYTMAIEERIVKTRSILDAFGYSGNIRIAFDEWNLRGWHHPNVDSKDGDYIGPRDKNDWNNSYTMADAVFSACFLNQCLKHCGVVGMANFAPTVNTRGLIYAHQDGIVLRPAYFVFLLYTRFMGDMIVDCWVPGNDYGFTVDIDGKKIEVPAIDVIATKDSGSGNVSLSIINRDPEREIEVTVALQDSISYAKADLHGITAPSKDAYNDVGQPDTVTVFEQPLRPPNGADYAVKIGPHSVNVLVMKGA